MGSIGLGEISPTRGEQKRWVQIKRKVTCWVPKIFLKGLMTIPRTWSMDKKLGWLMGWFRWEGRNLCSYLKSQNGELSLGPKCICFVDVSKRCKQKLCQKGWNHLDLLKVLVLEVYLQSSFQWICVDPHEMLVWKDVYHTLELPPTQ